MDLWFANGTKLKTGDTQTTCVSCHAGLAYALSRPVLRRVMHVDSPSTQEARLIEDTTRRVETYSTHQVLYDFNERRQTESRGTEAVLNAVILTSADDARNLREPSAPTKKALARLWETQRADGRWDWLEFGLEPWETTEAVYHGATFAAFAAGTAKGQHDADATAGIARLQSYLSTNYHAQHLYNRTWALLASTRLDHVVTDAQRQALIDELVRAQREDGGWSLEAMGPWRWSKTAPPVRAPGDLNASLLRQSDGYATGLVVYTLKQAGVTPSHPAIRKGIQWLETNQRALPVPDVPGRGWQSHSLNYDREHGSLNYDPRLGGEKGEPWRRLFMSDTATAFAILALAESE
jgi:squalene-hopene/tetraprenyl-beta-curcumene cyclase